MRVFEAPEQTRSAVLAKYRMALGNNGSYGVRELEVWEDLMSGNLGDDPEIAYDFFDDELIQSFETLQEIFIKCLIGSIPEGYVEWLCKEFVPLEDMAGDLEFTSDLIWPEDLPRAIETMDWFMQARKDSKVQNQFRLMFPEEISDGASVKNPLDWSCYQMEDVQDALTPGKVATARNERWDPQERGFTSDEADVAYDQDGIMIVRILKSRAATAYASGTRWCTSHPSTAKSYLATGPLYVVFDNGKKYAQAHFGFKNTVDYMDDYVSFMDVRDREIDDASDSIRQALSDTILQDAAEYHSGLLTVDEYIQQEYTKAVDKRDLEVSRAKKAMENAGGNEILGSKIFSKRFEGGNYQRDQAKRITDAEDALADAMVKIGAKAEKVVFRSNLSGFTVLSVIQEAIDGDEGIGGNSTVDITMDLGDMDRVLNTIVSNYTLWRNDSTFTDSGSNPSREEQMQAILTLADKNEIIDDRITNLLIKLPDWCRENHWDTTEMEGGIKRYYKRLPSPIPPELAIALYKDMGEKDSPTGRAILRRANAATKRRLGRLVDDGDVDDGAGISVLIEVGRISYIEDVLTTIAEPDSDIFSITKALRPIAPDMATTSKAFDRLDRMLPDDLYSIPIKWSSRNRVERNGEWIQKALTARKHPPVNDVIGTEIEIIKDTSDPDDDYPYRGEVTFTLRKWNGEVSKKTEYSGEWHADEDDATDEIEMEVDEEFIPQILNSQNVGYSILNDWANTQLNIERLEEITQEVMNGDDNYDDALDEVNNYWVQLFMINYAFQSRFGHDAWQTMVSGGTPGIEDDLLSRIMQIPINDTMTIGQYAENILPIERNGVAAKYRHPGLLLTDDDTIADPSAPKTFRDFSSRQLSPTPLIKGTYLNYDINLASPDDHMDLTNEILAIYQSGGQTIDHPAMSIFEGYFVEPHIPMSQRVVKQTGNTGLPKPPAILGYVCFNTRRWIEWDSEDGWTEMWRPGTKHRNRAKPDHILAVMPDIRVQWSSYRQNSYDSTFIPIRAGVIWCTACGGARPNRRGVNSFTTAFAESGGQGWGRSSSKCYCGGAEKYKILYDELAE